MQISILEEKTIEIVPFDEVRICNDSEQNMLVKLDALAMEAGESIMIDIPRIGEPGFINRSIQNGGKRTSAYVIGALIDERESDLEGEYEEE